MKLKFLKNAMGFGFGYFAGQVGEVKDKDAGRLIKAGVARQYDPKKDVPNVEPDLPEDFPGRKVLIENGLKTLEEVKKASSQDLLLDINGIGKTLNVQISEWFAKK